MENVEEKQENEKNVTPESFKKLCEDYVKNYNAYVEQGKNREKEEAEKLEKLKNYGLTDKDDWNKVKEELRQQQKITLRNEMQKIDDDQIVKTQRNQREKNAIAASKLGWLCTIGTSIVLLLLLFISNAFEEKANEAFRAGIVWAFAMFFLVVGISLLKLLQVKNILSPLCEKKWSDKKIAIGDIAIWVVCTFLGSIVGRVIVGVNWGWGSTTPKEGSSLANMAELCWCFVWSVGIALLLRVVWFVLNEKIAEKFLRKNAQENKVAMSYSTERKAKEKEIIEKFKKIENELKLYFEEKENSLEKKLSDDWGKIIEKWKAVIEKKYMEQPIDLSEDLYVANYYVDYNNFLPMTKVKCDKQPIVFLYDKPEKEGESFKVLNMLFRAVTASLLSCNGDVNLYLVDFLREGKTVLEEIEDLRVKNIEKNRVTEFADKIDEIGKENAKVRPVSVYNQNQKNKGNSDLKEFHVISFILKPLESSAEKDMLSKKWLDDIFPECWDRAILPVFYIEKNDWERADNVYSKLKKDYTIKNIWYAEEGKFGFDLKKYK